MEIAVANERAYWIRETLTLEQAQGRAWAKKADAFGTIAKFLQRPKDTEIELPVLKDLEAGNAVFSMFHIVSRHIQEICQDKS